MIINSQELNFTIVSIPHPYHVDFTIYDIEGFDEGDTKGIFDKPFWTEYNVNGSSHFTEDLEKANVFLHGEVKWDGCSNWYFDEQDTVMIHGCTKKDIQRIGDVMALCWDLTAKLCPHWIGKDNEQS